MLPYRKDDWRAASDQGRGEWLAARGYALSDGCRPGRDVVAGNRGDPQPDPPRLARLALVARARDRPSRPRPDARHGLPVPAGPPDPAFGRVVVLAGDLAVAIRAGYGLHLAARPARDSSCRCCPPTQRPCRSRSSRRPRPACPSTGSSRDEPPEWRVIDDVIDGSVTVTTSEFGESVMPDGRTSLYSGERLEMTARDDDPAHARMHNEVVYRLSDGGTEVRIEASGTVRSTETDFHMNVGLRVTLDGAPFFERGWLETIPRGSCDARRPDPAEPRDRDRHRARVRDRGVGPLRAARSDCRVPDVVGRLPRGRVPDPGPRRSGRLRVRRHLVAGLPDPRFLRLPRPPGRLGGLLVDRDRPRPPARRRRSPARAGSRRSR